MATTVARLEAVLSADTRQFDQSMDRSHGTLGKFGKAALVAGGVLGGALAIGLKRGADEMMESQRVTAQTNAVLKSTGGIANVTAKEVEKLAGSLSKKTGVDDEVIQSGENILLTFTRIRNETGKGNDIFNQATKATLDLSVAMHKDLNSAAVLVGKALNDPLKGLTALQRVGVTFSAQQKEQIKHLVDTGTAAKKAAKDVQEAAARVTAAQSAQETAARAVASAQEALRNAQNQVRASQEALIESNRQIKDAMDKVKEATHGVTEAKEALRDAQIKARDAQIALTDARRAARDELENLRASTVDAALSEEQAELSLARAKEHLEEVNKDANATELDRRQAALDVKKAEDNLRDAHRDRERAMRDLDAAEKKGIEGSKRVIDAKRGIKEADEGVSDAAYNVQKAQRDVQRAQEDVAKAHRDAEKAQQRVAEAQHDASVAAGKLADAQGKQATANAALSKAQADLANAQKRVKETAGDSSNILAAQKLILAELKKEFGGSAEAAGDTFGGQLDKLKNRLDENLGSLVAQASQVGILIVAFGSLASMVSGTVIATAALTAGTWLLSAAMTALPIIGWISAFVLLGVALTVLYKKSETFRNAVNFLKANWDKLLFAFGLLPGIAVQIVKHWDDIKEAMSKVKDLFLWVKENAGSIISAVKDAMEKPLAAIKEGFEKIAKPAETLKDVLTWLTNVGAKAFSDFKEAIDGPLGKLRTSFAYLRDTLVIIKDAIAWLLSKAGDIGGFFKNLAGGVGGALNRLNPFGEGGESPGGGAGPPGGGQLPGGLMSAANAIDAKQFPYVWGGGHSPGTYDGPYDCSGAVSALLRAGGLMTGSMVSGQFMSYGKPGKGKHLSILANPEHVYAIINGRAWGTSGQNPGGGAGWFSGGIRSGFAIRHPEGFDRGGWLKPGLTLAYNATGRPERVLGPGEGGDVIINLPNYVGSKTELMSWLQNAAAEFKRQNGRSAF